MKIAVLVIMVWLCAVSVGLAEDYVDMVEKGNSAYTDGDYKKAIDYYRQAEIDRPEMPEIYYNLGNALFNTQNYEEAAEKFEKALNTDDVTLQADAYYGLGNTQFSKEDYQKAIDAYTSTLKINPDDNDAKYNLELARNRLKEQMKQQEKNQDQQQQQKQDQEKQDQQQQEDQQQQNQQQQDQQKQQQQQQEKQDQQDQQDQQDDQEQQQQMKEDEEKPKDEMTKEDALRILRALEDEEKNTEKHKKIPVEGTYKGKDW